MSAFSPEELERYARHLVLPEVGGPGQQKLKQARVLMVGAGGLGAPALAYLAAAGVGHVRVVDDDVVTLSNLQRQTIHATDAVGVPKVASASDSLNRINPHCRVETIEARFTEKTAPALLADVDVALDGSDNFATRFQLADACEAARVALVSAAVNRFDGSLTVLAPHENNNPSLRDLYPSQPDEGMLPTCAEAGILGAVTGIMGSLQALEAIKLITGAGEPLIGRLLMMEGLSLTFSTLRYKRREGA
ncbi:MAG: molybdopterin-synthase adenylyltransferase MoeB [Pseudomonadota bacterium]